MDKVHKIPVEEIQYKPIEKITLNEIDDQVRVRQHLINHVLVGTLYPAILHDDIQTLKELKRVIEK